MIRELTIRAAREPGSCQRRAGEQGFSMLEAVIAVGVLGICMLPLLDFQMSVSDGAARLAQRQAVFAAEARAAEYLRSLPPAQLAGGSTSLAESRVTWKEVGRAPVRKALSEQGATARFDIAVVRLEYIVALPAGGESRRELDRLYWVPVTSLFEDQ